MDDVADDPLEAPPLTRRNDDRDRDEQEADTADGARLLVPGGGVANLADGAAGDAHPELQPRGTARSGNGIPPPRPAARTGARRGCASARPGFAERADVLWWWWSVGVRTFR